MTNLFSEIDFTKNSQIHTFYYHFHWFRSILRVPVIAKSVSIEGLPENWTLQSLEQSLSTWGDDFVRLDKNDDDLKDKDLKSLRGLDFLGDVELVETL